MNKKKAIIIAIAAVLLIGLTSAGLIIGSKGKKETGVKAETTEAMASADKEEKADELPEVQEDVKDTEKKAEEKKGNQKAETDAVRDEITESIDEQPKEQPKTTEKPKQPTEQKPEAEAPTTEQQVTETPKQPEQPKVTEEQPTTEKQKVWHEPVYEDVWVVDVPEHTEKQVVDVTYTEQCYCGFRFTTMEQFYIHLKDHDCAGYWGDVPLYTYEDVTIPEQGHYEQKLVKEGYWE